MRLFVAVEMAPAVVSAALDRIEVMRARAARLAPRSRITWLTAERLHVTVRFIGQVVETQAEAIREALRPPLDVEAFELTIAGVGAFPSTGSPRVVWGGLAAGRDQLVAIEAIVSHRLAAAGVARDERPFQPHLTLARVREAGGLRSAALLAGLGDTPLGTTPVGAITLFESRQSPDGQTYRAIQRTPLGSA